eukprot:gene22579-30844_t
MFRALIDKHPYVLVEFKPCLGFIFPDIVEGYSHWAYADMDMLAGRVDSFVSLQHIHTFDIITLSFGDNNRLYMRGQMTINRNSEHVRNLWARCNHLRKIGARLSAFYNDGPDKGKWFFQSAEGCYSRAVMDDTRVRVLILSTQVTDAYRADLLDKESFMIGGAILKCYQEPLNTSNLAAFEGFLNPSSRVIGNTTVSVLDSFSKGTEIFRVQEKCSYWISPLFDVCTSFVPSNASITYDGGHLYQHVGGMGTTILDGRCREASISHFQGWKRNYFHFSSRLPSIDANSLLISESGIIPLVVCAPDALFGELDQKGVYCVPHPSLPRMADVYGDGDAWASHFLSWRDVEEAVEDSWKAGRRKREEQKQIQLRWKQFHADLPLVSDGKLSNNIMNIGKLFLFSFENTTLLRGSGSMPSRSSVTQSLKYQQPRLLNALSYCAVFTKDLRRCTCRLYRSEVSIASIGKVTAATIRGSQFFRTANYLRNRNSTSAFAHDSKRVTLITAAWVHEYNSGMLDRMLSTWGGPKVVILQEEPLGGSAAAAFIPRHEDADITIVTVSVSRCQAEAGDAFNSTSLLDKMLFNIGLDLAGTDLVLVSPRNMTFHRYNGNGPVDEVILEEYLQLDKLRLQVAKRWQRQPIAVLLSTFSSLPPSDAHGRQALLTAYPVEGSGCGSAQPDSLRRFLNRSNSENDTFQSEGRSFEAFDFNAMDLTKESTVMVPIFFDTTVSQHGKGFVRFPEELSGSGCFGSSIIRILSGSGYSLFWAQSIYAVASELTVTQCGCKDTDKLMRKDMVTWMNRYYLRCSYLRRWGIEGVYSYDRYGAAFESDQLDKE